MGKRLTAGFLAFLMLFMTAFASFVPATTAHAAGKTLIIHYGGREDGNYEDWNLWIWEEGRDGSQVDFTREDDFGKIAVYQTNRTPASIGFIVRQGNWAAKDVEEDRFVAMDADVVEIWLTSGVADVLTEAPEGATSFDFAAMEEERLNLYNEEDALKLNVHYYSFSESYSADELEAYAWLGDAVGAGYPLTEVDEYGALFHVGFKVEDETTAGVKIGTNEHEIDLTQAVDNVLDVYMVEGNPTLWYDESEAVFDPMITSAAFSEDSSATINMQVSKALPADGALDMITISDSEGNTYEVSEAAVTDKDVTLTMKEALALSKTYTVSVEGYIETTISMSDILGSEYFDSELAYDGDDLGATYTKESTTFKVWAPMASQVELNLYEAGDGDCLTETIPMEAGDRGVWSLTKTGDLNGVYYTYSITNNGKTEETVDLYARTTGVNGNRGMVIDLDSTDPEGFENDVRPTFENSTDAVIYELHIRDLSSDASSGIENTGKFLGLTETGTTNSDGLSTGLDHIKELGVTHIQILPSYDYATVDESKLDTAQFNWGYDPKNYNVPEGSYSTDPYNGEVRVTEMKEMIQTLHENGIRVNMDVVYNHTYNTADSWFQKTVPDYYYRKNGENYSNGSGCGNETASDRAMMRKYIVDSVVYWVTEYHIDGFRFDLMALHDQETMAAVRAALDEIDPSIMVYGEGWTGGESVLPSSEQTLKASIKNVEGVGAFSDDIRDGIKGNVFDSMDKGFVNGGEGLEETIKFGVVGATTHPQVMVSQNVKGSNAWAGSPTQSINYISCHDNLTFWDKLAISNADDSEEDRIKMNKLGSAIIMTSQGVPFFQAGEEMLRSKPKEDGTFDENSYTSPDSTNSIKWDNKANVADTTAYYQGLIAFRKAHSALRMTETSDIQNNLVFLSNLDVNVVAYTISNHANGDSADKIFVAYNANNASTTIDLPAGEWDICVNAESSGVNSLGKASGSITLDPISALVLVQGDDTVVEASEASSDAEVADADTDADTSATQNASSATSSTVTVAIIVVIIALVAVIILAVVLRKKKK